MNKKSEVIKMLKSVNKVLDNDLGKLSSTNILDLRKVREGLIGLLEDDDPWDDITHKTFKIRPRDLDGNEEDTCNPPFKMRVTGGTIGI